MRICPHHPLKLPQKPSSPDHSSAPPLVLHMSKVRGSPLKLAGKLKTIIRFRSEKEMISSILFSPPPDQVTAWEKSSQEPTELTHLSCSRTFGREILSQVHVSENILPSTPKRPSLGTVAKLQMLWEFQARFSSQLLRCNFGMNPDSQSLPLPAEFPGFCLL